MRTCQSLAIGRPLVTVGLSVCTIVVLLQAACSSTTISHDYVKGGDYSRFQTFSWLAVEDTQPADDRASGSRLLHRRLKATLNQQLLEKGFVQNSDAPDFLVVYHVAIRDAGSTAPTTMYTYGANAGIPAGMSVGKYEEGTLVLDFLDAKTDRRIWRSIAKSALENKSDPEKTEKKIADLVRRMLAKFPPS